MKPRKSCNKILMFAVLGLMGLLVIGCSHRSTRGVLHHGTVDRASVETPQDHFSPKELVKTKEPSTLSAEGYFPSGKEPFADLLEEETEVTEDATFDQDLQELSSANDYWLNRTRAEQVTVQTGLQDIHFDFNSAQLNDQAKLILLSNAEWIKTHPQAEVTIEGHCDGRGTSAYNYILGEKRAVRTKNYLASLGVKAKQLHVISYGKDNPACLDLTEPCYQKNRRAHLVLGTSVAATAMR